MLYAFAPGKEYANVLVSAPEIATGETYTAILGGSADGLNEDGYEQAGSFSDGEAVGSATIGSYLSTIGNASASGGFGGMGGMNGGNRQPGGQRPGN